MIVRIAGGSQFRVDEAAEDRVLMLDLALDAAQMTGVEERWRDALVAILDVIEKEGEDLGTDPVPADLVLPRRESTLQEWRILLDSEAFEC